MGIILLGSSSGNGQEVDVNSRALVTLRPYSKSTLGSYRINAETGAIAATLAANSSLVSFQYTGSNLAMLNYVRVSVAVSAAITAAVATSLEIVWARNYTASDTGGTLLTITGNNAKDKTSDGTTAMGAIRVATTGALTPGTRTLDTPGFGGVNFGTGTAVGTTPLPLTPLYYMDNDLQYPITFAQNEGFIIRNPDAGPATGTFKIMVSIGWTEVLSTTQL